MAARGFAEQPSVSHIKLRNLSLTVGMGSRLSANVSQMLPVWPSLPQDWAHLIATDKFACYGIPALAGDGIVKLTDLVLVLWFRELMMKQVVPHLREARAVLIQPVVAYFELAVASSLAHPGSSHDTLQPSTIFGPSRRKALHMGIHGKKQILKNIIKDGSAETKISVMQRHKGLALSVMATKSGLYMQRCHDRFKDVSSLCLQWDEANHSSLCIMLGTAVDMTSGFGAILRPTMRWG